MRIEYPVDLTPDENDTVIAHFPDVPEAITNGKDEANALYWAQDALVVALGIYVDDHRDIPRPSKPKKGQKTVSLPAMVAAKLAIYQGMRDKGMTQAQLAESLKCDARQVRRLLDLDHNSRFDQVEAGLKAVGKELVVDVRDLAIA